MFKNFNEIEEYLIQTKVKKRIVLAGSHDEIALKALIRAKRAGFLKGILIGDKEKTEAILKQENESIEDYEIIDEKRELKSAMKAIQLVNEGKADMPMKGLMQTAAFLMAVQNPSGGLMQQNGLLNEMTAFYYPEQDRILITGDCAINIAPNLSQKKKIAENLIQLAKAFQCEQVKVAAISVVEKETPTIQSSVDAKELSQMEWGDDVLFEGPFALDNALDEEAAKHKGINSPVAGHADVLLMPDIHAGNIFHKCIHFFGHMPFASGTIGAKTPIIMNSRTDDEDAKYYSIMVAILLSILEESK